MRHNDRPPVVERNRHKDAGDDDTGDGESRNTRANGEQAQQRRREDADTRPRGHRPQA